MEPFLSGLDPDHAAAVAGLSLPYSNGSVEGISTKTKLNKRLFFHLPSLDHMG